MAPHFPLNDIMTFALFLTFALFKLAVFLPLRDDAPPGKEAGG